MIYVIMKEWQSPIFITHPKAHGYCTTRKEANAIVKRMNERASKNTYWVESVKEVKHD